MRIWLTGLCLALAIAGARAADSPQYLLNQLRGFREGRRYFPMMIYIVELQKDDYLRELATYFADQQVP